MQENQEVGQNTGEISELLDMIDDFAVNSLPELEANRDYFYQLLEQAQTQVNGQVLTGSNFLIFQEIAAQARRQLDWVDKNLDFSILYSASYRTRQAASKMRSLKLADPQAMMLVNAARIGRRLALERQGRQLASQTALFGNIYMDQAPYFAMPDRMDCSLTSFAMVFSAVNHTPIPPVAIKQALAAHGFDHAVAIENSLLLGTLKTPEFISRHPQLKIECREFVGFTVEDLGRAVAKVRHRSPNASIHAALCVRSEKALDEIMHYVVPTRIAPGITIAHDPAEYGGPDREFETQDLLQRWYQAQGYGYLVVSYPTKPS